MFRQHSSIHRAEPPPTAVELWAKCEAKSPTMAADLLTQSRRQSERRATRRMRYAVLLAIIAVSMLRAYWIQ